MEQTVTTLPFGTTKSGEAVSLFRIPNNTNDYIELLTYGCTIKGIYIQSKPGFRQNMLCGMETLAQYESSDLALGAIIGSVWPELPACTAHKVWDVQEVGGNYVFLSCRVTAEETGSDSALAVGARIMWVNLNRIVIDIFLTPEHAATVNLTCNFPFHLADAADSSGYMLRTFCPHQVSDGQEVPVSQTAFADLAFLPVERGTQVFFSQSDEVKPMAELACHAAGMSISAYSNLDSIQCALLPAVQGVQLNASMLRGVSLKGGETLTGRFIYGFDRLHTQEEVESPLPSPFSAFF